MYRQAKGQEGLQGPNDIPSNEHTTVVGVGEAESDAEIDHGSDEVDGHLQVECQVDFLELPNVPKDTAVFDGQS